MHLSIHSKPPGFEVSMLIKPNASPNPQSLIDKLFFGDKYPAREVPILSYQIQQQKLSYQPYNSTVLEGLEKAIDLEAFPKVLVEKKKFYLGTDKFGRDLLSRILVGARISFFYRVYCRFYFTATGAFIGQSCGILWRTH
jgi:peptide/nickel transport system permease protein